MKPTSKSSVVACTTAVTLAWMAFAPVPAWAEGCQEKLMAVNERLAEAGDLGPTRAGLEMMRDQGATMCSQGQDAMAMQILGMLEASLPPSGAEAAAVQRSDADSKAVLTDEFLAGTWCSMDGEERSQLVFSTDGTYRFCLNDTVRGPYGYCSREPRPTADWLARYPRTRSVEQDTIVFDGKSGPKSYSTFKRGECSKYGR